MPRRPKSYRRPKAAPRREQFADGSALVTYADGSQLILESDLAQAIVSREAKTVNYKDPPPQMKN
jgi:hypothetical protein